jgi:hypothetical protein
MRMPLSSFSSLVCIFWLWAAIAANGSPSQTNRPPQFISAPIRVACVPTNLPPTPQALDLGQWSVIQFQTNAPEQGAASWTLSASNTVVTQSRNADASIYLSDFPLAIDEISGTFTLGSDGDDDYVGFAFGYQDRGHFYLFDWKERDQNDPCGAAQIGMSVKVFSAETELSCQDLWPSVVTNSRVRTLFHNSVPWERNRQYTFALRFVPGTFTITVSDTTNLLANVTLNDTTYTAGRFGFYNYSQGTVGYTGFVRQDLSRTTYTYAAQAIDPEADEISFSLSQAPPQMQINPTTGQINWELTPAFIGEHSVVVMTSDSHGNTNSQSFTLSVRPDSTGCAEPTDLPPLIVIPPTDQRAAPGQTIAFQVKAAGSPPLSYQWLKNGENLVDANSSVLTLPSVPPEAAGAYRVIVTNASGSATSSPGTLTIVEPVVITQQPSPQSINLGSNAVFTVSASGTPPFTYQWRKNGGNLPGANGPILTIAPVSAADGGRYSVSIDNGSGAVNSAGALLTVILPQQPVGDNFADRTLLVGDTGLIRSSSLGAGFENGEPRHADKPVGRSVWFRWRPSQGGVAQFTTAGSAFDTVLAIYTGDTLTRLIPIASDDDRGGFLASAVHFNATQGTDYQIAVDGLGGASGEFSLAWELAPNVPPLPVIVAHPTDQVVTPGAPAIFQVTVPGNVAYQWFFNDLPILDATLDTYRVPTSKPAHVGRYFVRVTAGNQSVDSQEVTLQLSLTPTTGPIENGLARDKFAEAFAAANVPPPAARVQAVKARRQSVARGFVGSQIFSTVKSSKEIGEPNHCGNAGGASEWYVYAPPASGLLTIDTEGSNFDTVLGVFAGSNFDVSGLQELACDNNSGSDGLTSRVSLPVTTGTPYFIAIDGVAGAKGVARLNYSLLGPPPLRLSLEGSPLVGPFRLELQGPSNQLVTINVSSTLTNWSVLVTTNLQNGLIILTDPEAATLPSRFYRALANP